MLNLSSDQRRQVVGAAATLTPAARPAFIGDVETTLAQHCMGKVPKQHGCAARDKLCARRRGVAKIK
jgi:hypothetical protein